MRLVPNLSVIPLEEYLRESRHWDLFLACSSFEERCKTGCSYLAATHASLGHAVVFNYKETDADGMKAGNLGDMAELLRKTAGNVRIFDTESVSRPSEGVKGFLRYLRDANLDLRGQSVVVDITVFTKPYFFLLLKTLQGEFSVGRFDAIYTEPREYGKRTGSGGGIVLTEGLDRTETIPGFYGSTSGTDEVLIVLMGFEGNRSLDVFRVVNPTTTYAVNGFPSFQAGWHRMSLDANLRFLRESGACEGLHYASAIDPFETEETLGKIVAEARARSPNSNVVIAPLGTKTQALGVLLYAMRDPSVKVIYPFPSRFRTDYSTGCGSSWIMEVVFHPETEAKR